MPLYSSSVGLASLAKVSDACIVPDDSSQLSTWSSQWAPSQPLTQLHWYDAWWTPCCGVPSTHSAPFWHGALAQSSMLAAQFSPL
jgi:hypothetical protein